MGKDAHNLTLIEPSEIVLHNIIGEGSFGRVWSAMWNSSQVAVKEFVFAQVAVSAHGNPSPVPNGGGPNNGLVVVSGVGGGGVGGAGAGVGGIGGGGGGGHGSNGAAGDLSRTNIIHGGGGGGGGGHRMVLPGSGERAQAAIMGGNAAGGVGGVGGGGGGVGGGGGGAGGHGGNNNGLQNRRDIIEEIVGEAGIMSYLRHPRILQLFGCSLTAQAIWIVSELCSQGSLRQVLDDKVRWETGR